MDINLVKIDKLSFGWPSYKNKAPQLRVEAKVGVITPSMEKHLWLTCINLSEQIITCNGFWFATNRFKKTAPFITPHPSTEMKKLSIVTFPYALQYSAKIDQHFKAQSFHDENFKKLLSRYKWLARIQLKFLWRIIMTTNIKEFNGKLSKDLIEEILSAHFSKNWPFTL